MHQSKNLELKVFKVVHSILHPSPSLYWLPCTSNPARYFLVFTTLYLQVTLLREELEKEAMYVEYLERLLQDIELRRQERRASKGEEKEGEDEEKAIDYTVISGSPDNKQQFLEDQCERVRQKANLRASLHLDIASPRIEDEEEGDEGVGEDAEAEGEVEGDKKAPTSFVTVINVPAPKEGKEAAQEQPRSGTYTKPRAVRKEQGGAGSLGRRPAPRVVERPVSRRRDSRESLGSVSSPLSSPGVEGGGEAPALLLDSSSPSPPTTSSGRTKPEPPVRAPRARELGSLAGEPASPPSLSSNEEVHMIASRGRPDGGEVEEDDPAPASLDRASKVGSPPPLLLSHSYWHTSLMEAAVYLSPLPSTPTHSPPLSGDGGLLHLLHRTLERKSPTNLPFMISVRLPLNLPPDLDLRVNH